MSFGVAVGVIAALFVIGIVAGVLVVVARPGFGRPGGARGGGRPEPPGPDGDGPPPWPGRRG